MILSNLRVVHDYAMARSEYKRLFQMHYDLMCEYVKLRENMGEESKKYITDLAVLIDSVREEFNLAVKELDTAERRYNNRIMMASTEELKELLSEVTALIVEVDESIKSLKYVKVSISNNGRKSLAAKEIINERLAAMKRYKESCIERKKEIKFTIESTQERTKRSR